MNAARARAGAVPAGSGRRTLNLTTQAGPDRPGGDQREATMRRAALVRLVLVVLLLGAVLSVPAATGQVSGFGATVTDYEPPVETMTFTVTDFGTKRSNKDDRTGEATWRVVERTGNCCENYVTTTPSGRILDFGGTYVNFTDDDGRSWKQVRPVTPLVNGEGAIVGAPNGDILGVGWDPYSGDHLQAFKYSAADDAWYWLEMPLHTPFFDREWIGVVPGPFQTSQGEVPYISFVRGGYPSKETWLMSTDGLTYLQVSSTVIDQTLTEAVETYLDPAPRAYLDWIQPNTNTGLTALGPRSALAAPDFNGDAWALLDGEQLRWTGVSLPEGKLEGRYLSDARGRLHNLVPQARGFVYGVSPDGGRSWKRIEVALPANRSIEQIDFRANAAAGVAAVAIHGHDPATQTDVDMLYKIDITRDKPRLTRLYQLGKGDVSASARLGASIRFDFQTVAILPDGRVAMSFLDSTTMGTSLRTPELVTPALAIELETRF
jgi:hypothetical protein